MLVVLATIQALGLVGCFAGFAVSMTYEHFVTAVGFVAVGVAQIIGLVWTCVISDRPYLINNK